MLKWHYVVLDNPRNNQNIPQTAGQNLFIAYSGKMMVATVTGKVGEGWRISFPSQRLYTTNAKK